MDNPVYYVQYGHARCAAIIRRAAELGAERPAFSAELAAELTLPEELAILRRLGEFPDFVADAAAAREPHRLTTYLMELAGEFQSFSRGSEGPRRHDPPPGAASDGRVAGTWNWRKTAARLYWWTPSPRSFGPASVCWGSTPPTPWPNQRKGRS